MARLLQKTQGQTTWSIVQLHSEEVETGRPYTNTGARQRYWQVCLEYSDWNGNDVAWHIGIQWNPFTADTIGTQVTVLISGVVWYRIATIGTQESVHNYFRGVRIERFHCIGTDYITNSYKNVPIQMKEIIIHCITTTWCVFVTQSSLVIPEPVVDSTQGSSSGLVQSLEGGVVTKRSTRIAGLKKEDSMCVILPCYYHPTMTVCFSSSCDSQSSSCGPNGVTH